MILIIEIMTIIFEIKKFIKVKIFDIINIVNTSSVVNNINITIIFIIIKMNVISEIDIKNIIIIINITIMNIVINLLKTRLIQFFRYLCLN